MDASVINKNQTPDVIGTRNTWPLPANHEQLNSGQSNFRVTPGELSETNARENKASNAPQGFQASISLLQRPGIGRGIGRFAGSHSALFPPGPQKSYHSTNTSTSIQNTNLQSRFTSSVSDIKPTTTRTNYFEKWRAEERRVDGRVEESMRGNKIQNSSDSDSDGGVTLAMVQAAFLQGPGIVGLPLRPVVPKSNAVPQRQQKQKKKRGGRKQQQELATKEREPKQPEQEKQGVEVAKKPTRKLQSSLSSHMAAKLQTPGAVGFTSAHRSSSVTTTSPRYSTPASIIIPAESRKVGGTSDEKQELGPTPVEAPCIPPKPPTPKERTEDKLADKYIDLDTTHYQGIPSTPFIYPRKNPPEPIVPAPITGQNLLSATPRGFRQLKDGDIVGNGAPELPKENKGRRIMEKMGYKEGTPLGVSGDGKLEPVEVEIRVGNRGLGLSKEDLARKERMEKANRIEKASRIERELFERVAKSERVAQMQRESLEIVIQNHAAQLYQSAQAYPGQIDLTQMTQTKASPTRTLGASQEVIQQWQLEQMGLLGAAQFLKYTTATPWEIQKTRERVSQILSYLDSSGVLGVTDYNSIIWSCMSRVIADLQKSRLGFVLDADLVKIARREFIQVVTGKEQAGSGW